MNYLVRSQVLRSSLGLLKRVAAHPPLRDFHVDTSDEDRDYIVYQGRCDDSSLEPLLLVTPPEYKGPKLPLPKLPIGVKRILIQDRRRFPRRYIPPPYEETDSHSPSPSPSPSPSMMIGGKKQFVQHMTGTTQRSMHTDLTSPNHEKKKLKAIQGDDAQAAPSLYLQLGLALARLVMKPNSSSPHRLEFVCDIAGFIPAYPSIIAHNDHIFIMGRSIRFIRDDHVEDEYDGRRVFELWLYHCQNLPDSDRLRWTVYAPTPAVQLSAFCPYLVHLDDKIYMFGGRDEYAPAEGSHWGCCFDCDTRAWIYIDDLPCMRHNCCTVSHFIWQKKVYLLGLRLPVGRILEPDHRNFVCSYDTENNKLCDETVMFEELNEDWYHRPKIVVGDILLVFSVREMLIRPFDLKTKRWIVGEEAEMTSFSPPPVSSMYSDLDPSLFVAKWPHAHGYNELLLLWQDEVLSFQTSRIRVQVEQKGRGEAGGNEVRLRVDVVQGCMEVDVERDVIRHGSLGPGIPGWS